MNPQREVLDWGPRCASWALHRACQSCLGRLDHGGRQSQSPSLAQFKFKAKAKMTLDMASGWKEVIKEKHHQTSVLAFSAHLSWFIKEVL